MKKHLKSLLIAVVIIPMLVIMAGCGGSVDKEVEGSLPTLAAPGGIRINGEKDFCVWENDTAGDIVISWDAVGVDGYQIMINESLYTSSSNELPLPGDLEFPCKVNVKVMALGNGSSTANSDWSETKELKVKTKLPMITILSYADSYRYIHNGDVILNVGPYIEFSPLDVFPESQCYNVHIDLADADLSILKSFDMDTSYNEESLMFEDYIELGRFTVQSMTTYNIRVALTARIGVENDVYVSGDSSEWFQFTTGSLDL